jgi:hypothetical protein
MNTLADLEVAGLLGYITSSNSHWTCLWNSAKSAKSYLCGSLQGSSYFKSMLQLTTIDEIIEEIKNYADTLDVPLPFLAFEIED